MEGFLRRISGTILLLFLILLLNIESVMDFQLFHEEDDNDNDNKYNNNILIASCVKYTH